MDGTMDILSLLREFGPLIGLIVFYIYRDARRESHFLARIEQLEDEMRKIIMPLVERSTEVIAENSQVMRENSTVMRELSQLVGKPLTKTLRKRKIEGQSEQPKPE